MEKLNRFPDAATLLSAGRSRFARILAAVAFCLSLAWLYNHRYDARGTPGGVYHEAARGSSPFRSVTAAERRMMDAAGNRTLGFDSVSFINLPGRFDRVDSAAIMAYLSGIDILEVPGVLADDIHDAGMPPEHLERVKKGEKGCWRAHANIWAQMLRERTPAVLILESDAAWDIEVREIMANIQRHFTYFLHGLDSRAVPSNSYEARQARMGKSPAPPETLVLNPEDPWHSTHWDLLSFGQCFEDQAHKEVHLRFPDPHVPAGKDYFGMKLGNERLVRQSGGIVCTTAYAISQTGAAKLLLRSAIDLDNPVDLVMRRMIRSGDLRTYSVTPTVFGQWEYVEKIGMKEKGANSDIHGGENGEQTEVDMSGWDNVKKTNSVWQDREGHPEVAFENMGLIKAWELIIGNKTSLKDSQFQEADGN